MALSINSNIAGAVAAKNLNRTYGSLATSIERLSSGLRINGAADDPVDLGVREMMRSDIAVYQQGIANTADAINMLQVADSALGDIDSLLTQMRTLAAKAASGSYSDTQRAIINSEYQAMASEIDRIANATNYNGVKLLDGSLNYANGGRGLMVQVGGGSDPSEDYYYMNLGDVRASSSSGLRVGGDAKNDIWAQGGAAREFGSSEGCCAGGFDSLTGAAGFKSGDIFSFGYNWDGQAGSEADLVGGRYSAGLWQAKGDESLQDLVDKVNAGTQARVGIVFDQAELASADVLGVDGATMSAYGICVDKEAYFWGDETKFKAALGSDKTATAVTGGGANMAVELTSAINSNADSKFWAMHDSASNKVYVFAKDGGSLANDFLAGELGAAQGSADEVEAALGHVSFEQVDTGVVGQSAASFSLGGESWARLRAVESSPGIWNVVLEGRDTGEGYNLAIADVGSAASYDLSTDDSGAKQLRGLGASVTNLENFSSQSFAEVQNAANGAWAGADIRSQDQAQQALEALEEAMGRKETLRSNVGAMMNRLENTLTHLEGQVIALQNAESRISDVDVAQEVLAFTTNNIRAQTAASILAQANALPELALMLL